MPICSKCNTDKVIKNGFHHEKQRYKCKECGFQFTRETPRGRPVEEKASAVMLYCLGLSLNAIARIYKVTPPAILRWIRKFAEKTYEKPKPKEVIIMELDEMWHFLNSKKTKFGYGKLIVVIPVSSLTGNVAVVMKEPLEGSIID